MSREIMNFKKEIDIKKRNQIETPESENIVTGRKCSLQRLHPDLNWTGQRTSTFEDTSTERTQLEKQQEESENNEQTLWALWDATKCTQADNGSSKGEGTKTGRTNIRRTNGAAGFHSNTQRAWKPSLNHKRTHLAWSHVYEMPITGKFMGTKGSQRLQGAGR